MLTIISYFSFVSKNPSGCIIFIGAVPLLSSPGIATLAAPTVMKEPEKPAEAETTEGESGAEGSEAAAADGEKTPAEGEKKDADDKKGADKKPSEEKK